MSIGTHKSCNPEVWIVELYYHYEKSDIIGVYDSKEKAESACLEYMTKSGNFEKWIQDLNQDDEVEWTYRNKSVRMTHHNVQ